VTLYRVIAVRTRASL